MTKKKLITRVIASFMGANLLIAGLAFAATDNVDNQTLVNEGALTVTYVPTSQFFGSFSSEPGDAQATLDFSFANLTFTNTTGSSSAFTLSWTTENLQASTGFAAAGTGFNYTTQLQGQDDASASIDFTAGSVGSANVALSNTGISYNFEGSGASGTTSDSADLLTGSGAAFSLEGVITPIVVAKYDSHLAGFYSGTMTFTII